MELGILMVPTSVGSLANEKGKLSQKDPALASPSASVSDPEREQAIPSGQERSLGGNLPPRPTAHIYSTAGTNPFLCMGRLSRQGGGARMLLGDASLPASGNTEREQIVREPFFIILAGVFFQRL